MNTEFQVQNKLQVGMANFDNNYGIKNKAIAKTQKKKIFEFINQNSLSVDSAFCYKNNLEEVPKEIDIYTKVSSREFGMDFIEHIRKKKESIKGIYVHDGESIMDSKKNFLSKLKEEFQDSAIKVGVSIYSKREMEEAIKQCADIIQLPYNVLDSRFDDLIEEAKNKKIKLVTRSIFLQGVLLKDKIEKKPLNKFNKYIYLLEEIATSLNLTRLELCIHSSLANSNFENHVIGVRSIDNLLEIYNIASKKLEVSTVKKMNEEIRNIKILDEKFLNPRLW